MQNRLLPKFQFAGTHSFTWAERGVLPKNKTQCPRSTLEPKPLDAKDTRRSLKHRRRSFQFRELKFLINDKSEPIYLLWTRTRRFSWCTVIRVIREHKSLSESTQRSTPHVLLSNALWDSLRTKESSVCLGFNLARIESSAFSSR